MRRVAVSQLVLALALAGLGAFFIFEAQSMRVAPAYSRVGPQIIPTIVGIATVLIGLALAFVALRGGWPTGHDTPGARSIGWAGVALVSAGLLLQIVLFERAGFVLSSALLFLLVTSGFHSRAYLRDGAIGLALSLVAYLGFTRGLGLTLPPGVLEGLL